MKPGHSQKKQRQVLLHVVKLVLLQENWATPQFGGRRQVCSHFTCDVTQQEDTAASAGASVSQERSTAGAVSAPPRAAIERTNRAVRTILFLTGTSFGRTIIRPPEEAPCKSCTQPKRWRAITSRCISLVPS